MQAVANAAPPAGQRRERWRTRARACVPARAACALAVVAALLLVFAFPDFDLWPLAWVGLAPLLVAVARSPRGAQSFVLGWMTGTLFFYASCWWLTYSMIHFGGLPAGLAFLLLVPGALIVGLFPALFAFGLARLCARWGLRALCAAPPLWAACEWARLGVTGQLWNALGYSQAYHPALIQTARWGGVYAVGFLLVAVNAAVAYLLLRRTMRAVLIAFVVCGAVAATDALARATGPHALAAAPAAVVVAVQPNVPISFDRTAAETATLVTRHVTLSAAALRADALRAAAERWAGAQRAVAADGTEASALLDGAATPRVVVWPESPMNFSYADDAEFREFVGAFARTQHTAVIFNSLEPAPAGGAYNSAVLVDEAGQRVAQYDKIRLLPFGEYVPLPRWFPPAWLLSGVVGEFTPGTQYPLMPLGPARVGVFICFESAFPAIARTFTRAGADALINISNDGYLGRTPVLRQHLANAVLRAVENQRPVLRVTNTGISALIAPDGTVLDATDSFTPAVRTWPITRARGGQTWYTRHGDLFVALCALVCGLLFISSQWPVGRRLYQRKWGAEAERPD